VPALQTRYEVIVIQSISRLTAIVMMLPNHSHLCFSCGRYFCACSPDRGTCRIAGCFYTLHQVSRNAICTEIQHQFCRSRKPCFLSATRRRRRVTATIEAPPEARGKSNAKKGEARKARQFRSGDRPGALRCSEERCVVSSRAGCHSFKRSKTERSGACLVIHKGTCHCNSRHLLGNSVG